MMARVMAGGWRRRRDAAPGTARAAVFDSARAVVLGGARGVADLDPPVRRPLAAEFGAQALSDRICPAELGDGTVALFALAEHVGSDQADELARRIEAAGRVMADPPRYVLSAASLLALARGDAGGPPAAPGARERTPTALAGVFQDMVEWGVRHGASDLHLNVCRDEAESEVRYTLAGRYIAPERFRRMPTALLLDVLAVAWMDIRGGNGAVFDPLVEQQGSLLRQVDGRDIVLRWASLAADRGPSVCLRFLERDARPRPASLEALGYREDQVARIERVMRSESGAIVFAGTVGSGKSTTLATLIAGLPPHRKVVTLEEPVEYRIERAVQNTIGRYLDREAHEGYAAKLRALKRSAMTDVLLGEIRDAETGRAFMDLAGSGVNVYTTVHAPSAAGIVDRLASEFIGIPRDFLGTPGILKLLVFQALLPALCPACAVPADARRLAAAGGRPAAYWERWLAGIESAWPCSREALRLRNEAGCEQCRIPQLPELAGYRGRTVAAECLEPGLPAGGAGPRAADTRGAMAHAMDKALRGEIDPRDVEVRFMAFETLALREGRAP